MATQPIQWPTYRPLPPKLQYYGKFFSDRFLGPKSTLKRHQIKALDNIVRWFTCAGTRNNSAIVVIPTAAGKMGILCCLPFAIGGGISKEAIPIETVNINKPILIIAPGLSSIRLLEYNLLYDPYLIRKQLLQQPDKVYNYTVHTVTKGMIVADVKTSQYDIVLATTQKWRKTKEGAPMYDDFPNDIFSMVLVYEAHMIPNYQWEEIVNKFHQHARIVFFSSSHTRADGTEVLTNPTLLTKNYAYRLTRLSAIQEKLIRDVQLSSLAPCEEVDEAQRAGYMRAVVAEVKRCLKVKNERQPLVGRHKHMGVIIVKDQLAAVEVRDVCINECEYAEDEVKVVQGDVAREVMNSTIKQVRAGEFKLVIIDQTLVEDFEHAPISVGGIVTKIHSLVDFAHFVGHIQLVTQYEDLDIKANVITHKYFKQRELFARYVNPVIPDEEDSKMDTPAD